MSAVPTKDPNEQTFSFPKPVALVEEPRTPPKAPQKTLRMVLRDCTSHDYPPHVMRAKLTDWDNETEDELKRLVELARAVRANKPIRSYVMSAQDMAEIVGVIFGP